MNSYLVYLATRSHHHDLERQAANARLAATRREARPARRSFFRRGGAADG